MLCRSAIVVCVLGLLCVATEDAAGLNPYFITDLGAVAGTGGNNAKPLNINDSGQVAGTIASNSHAFLWTPAMPNGRTGTLADLGTLVGGTNSPAYSINNSGQVVGTAAVGSDAHVFLYTGGSMVDLGTFPKTGQMGSSGAVSYGINDGGQIAVTNLVTWPSLNFAEYSYRRNADGTVLDLAGTGYAMGINGGGAIIGFNNGTLLAPTTNQACRWDSAGNQTALTPLSVDNVKSYGYGINNNGVCVGSASIASSSSVMHAVSWDSGGSPTDLGTLGGNLAVAYAINNTGEVVGSSQYTGGGSTFHASLFVSGGAPIDLSSDSVVPSLTAAGWTYLMRATGVNASGQIVGWGTKDSANHGFLLTPALSGDANLDGTVNINDLSKVLTNYDKTGLDWAGGDFDGNGTVNISDLSKVLTNYDKSIGSSAAGVRAVPEPSALLLAASGLIGLVAYAWRKRK
jgi:probable HAF family extracellular repeat protein